MRKVVFCFTEKFQWLVFRCIIAFALVLSIFLGGLMTASAEACLAAEVSTGGQVSFAAPSLWDKIKDIFVKDQGSSNEGRKVMVYPGGLPLGFTLECEGVMVVAIGEVAGINGVEKPLEGKNIKSGDVIKSVDGKEIFSAAEFQSQVNDKKGAAVALELERDGVLFMESVVPAYEASTSTFRLGLWIRDNAAGVGTLTYVRADNGRFGALGHPISDIDTGKTFPVSDGYIYKCSIVGVNRGTRGNPGELRGIFLKNGSEVGHLDNNNDYGVYGNIDEQYIKENIKSQPIEVGFKEKVKTGKATILTTIDGGQPESYDIEIIKLVHQAKSDNKSMVIKVTDNRLIAATGGVVQGMSGSPIIQDGKLIGAVTHVFVNDPTKGFGVYIDWMIDN